MSKAHAGPGTCPCDGLARPVRALHTRLLLTPGSSLMVQGWVEVLPYEAMAAPSARAASLVSASHVIATLLQLSNLTPSSSNGLSTRQYQARGAAASEQ